MASIRASRLFVLLLVVTAGLGVASAYQNDITDAGYVDVKASPCWSCHVSWSPPLRDMALLVPPTGVQAGLGEEFDYTVRVDPAWLPNALPEFIRLEPSLDIGAAPSLAFADSPKPILGNITRGVIETQSGIPINSQSDFVVIEVPAGTSEMVIRMRPSNTDPNLGPDLILNIYPGRDNADGIPTEVDEAGPGAEETFKVDSAMISEGGFGPWAIEAEVKPPTDSATPNLATNVEYQVITDQYFNATGGVQFQTMALGIDNGLKGQSTVFTWRLRVVDTPEPGEMVGARLNLTSYYRHTDGSTEDVAYTTHNFTAPVTAVEGGGVGFEASTIVVETEAATVSLSRISEVIGYISAILVLASIYTGGMFGKKSRRQLNRVFYSAKRRVAFHNFLSYAIIATAFIHTFLFLWHWPNIEGNYHWSLGLIWGGAAILCMFGLGITGAIQVPMIRQWNYAVWRWSHFGLSIAVIVFTIVHILLDGGNFGDVQEAIGWKNPLDTR